MSPGLPVSLLWSTSITWIDLESYKRMAMLIRGKGACANCNIHQVTVAAFRPAETNTLSCVSCSAHGQVTGIHPSERQGSYIVDSSPQDATEPKIQSSKGWEKFWLEATEVQDLLKENKMTEDDLLQSLITPASSLARPPISSFHVG